MRLGLYGIIKQEEIEAEEVTRSSRNVMLKENE